MMYAFRPLFALILAVVITGSSGMAQPCSPEALIKLPGQWKGPRRGSVENISPADLSKENALLAEIQKMMSTGYAPFGLVASYSYVFGYNKYYGKKWTADPYEYGLHLLEYLCDHQDNDIKKKWVNPETPTSVYISINKIWRGGLEVNAADYPDDRHEPFDRLERWPVRMEGYWMMAVRDSGSERSALKQYRYLITYEDKLPFRRFTRREYLEYKIPIMKYELELSERSLAEIDPKVDAASKRVWEDGQERLKVFRQCVRQTENLLTTMTKEELNEGAIVINDPNAEFSGFRKEGEPWTYHLVKPDLSYYRPLPKWVPQFFCIDVKLSTDQEVYRKAIADVEKAIDFSWFRRMLGSTTVIPAKGSAAQSK